jgi:hypothetical protein
MNGGAPAFFLKKSVLLVSPLDVNFVRVSHTVYSWTRLLRDWGEGNLVSKKSVNYAMQTNVRKRRC